MSVVVFFDTGVFYTLTSAISSSILIGFYRHIGAITCWREMRVEIAEAFFTAGCPAAP